MKYSVMTMIAASLTLMPAFADKTTDQQAGKTTPALPATSAVVTVTVPADTTIQKLADVKKIFIAPLGTGEGSELIRQKVITQLMQSSSLVVVESPDEADATLNGVAELNSHLLLYQGSGRTRYSPEVVVRLMGKNKKLLWTEDTTTSSFFGSRSVSKVSSTVADKLVKDLTEAIAKDQVPIATKEDKHS